jgi:hypothetical protein
MLRTSAGLCLLVVLGVAGACSSKSTQDDDDAAAGKGSILGGGSNGGGTGGASTAGTRTDTGGTATSTGGTTGNGLCPGPILTCVDATMATFCDPDTGVEETFSCVDDAKDIGFNSSGCKQGTALTEDECAVESVADQLCWDGAEAFAFCGGLTDNELLGLYIDCFQKVGDWNTIVTCVGEYVSPTMMSVDDCNAGAVACLPGAAGEGGSGSGGAGSDPTAGAGGAN